MLRIIEVNIGNKVFEIPGYNLMLGLSIIVTILLLPLVFSGAGLSKKKSLISTSITLIMALIGARLFFFALYPEAIGSYRGSVFEVSFKDFTLYGAVFGAFTTVIFLSWSMKFSLYEFLDRAVWLTGLSMLLARMGCVLNGCCYGKPTKMPWGIPMLKDSLAHREYLQTHPFGLFMEIPRIHFTQGYELLVILVALATAFVIFIKSDKQYGKGIIAISFGMTITVGRFIVYFFREFPNASQMSDFIRGPLIYLTAFTILFIMYAKRR